MRYGRGNPDAVTYKVPVGVVGVTGLGSQPLDERELPRVLRRRRMQPLFHGPPFAGDTPRAPRPP